jgi:5-methylcytosine-specific restriction endonuclease McrA
VRQAQRVWEAKNRDSVLELKRQRYARMTPKPFTCSRCGWSGQIRNYLCPECNKERGGQRIRVQREAVREHNRQYYEQNKDAIVKRVRRYEQTACQTDEYKALKKAKRDWKKAGDVTWQELREIYLRDGGACVYCGTPVSVVTRPASAVGFDHVIPYSKGGQHTADNLVTCCVPCNSRKHNSLLDEE